MWVTNALTSSEYSPFIIYSCCNPRLGQRWRTQTAKLGCSKVLRVSSDHLGERSCSVGTPCRRTGFCIRRNKEPINRKQQSNCLRLWTDLLAHLLLIKALKYIKYFCVFITKSDPKSLVHSSCQFNHCFLVTVRSGGYEPPFCQYGGWTVAAVRRTNNLLCPKTRPFIRTQKRPHFALTGKKQASLMLTFSD